MHRRQIYAFWWHTSKNLFCCLHVTDALTRVLSRYPWEEIFPQHKTDRCAVCNFLISVADPDPLGFVSLAGAGSEITLMQINLELDPNDFCWISKFILLTTRNFLQICPKTVRKYDASINASFWASYSIRIRLKMDWIRNTNSHENTNFLCTVLQFFTCILCYELLRLCRPKKKWR